MSVRCAVLHAPRSRAGRARLSYEQFSQFLVAIKELNAGRTSREDTLGAAKALFGPNNLDLYGESNMNMNMNVSTPGCEGSCRDCDHVVLNLCWKPSACRSVPDSAGL